MPAARYFDPSVLERLLGGNRTLMVKFAGRFVDTARAALMESDQALAAKNLEILKHLGHRTRSAALTVGAHEMAALCRQLEDLPDLEHAVPIVAALHAAFALTADRIRDAGLA